jgi:integrase
VLKLGRHLRYVPPSVRAWVGDQEGDVSSVKRDPRDGRWLARWRDPGGAQRKKSFRRKVDAERFLNDLTAEMAHGSYVDPAAGKVSFRSVAARWASSRMHLKASTSDRYASIVRPHLIPKWGGWSVNRMATRDIAEWLNGLHAAGVSAGTVRKVHRVLSLMLDAAIADSLIGRNPARGIRLPRQVASPPRFLSGEELGRLVTAAGPDGDELALLAVTGLRFGEFAALRVGDFDERRRRLMIRASVSVVGSSMVSTTPKTHRTREVSVPPSLVPALLSRAVGRPADAVLFTSSSGQVLRLNNWRRRVFALACKGAGIAGLKPHDLRHTAASLAVRSGANVKVVQRMLGHASAAMTLDAYSGLFDDDLDVVALAMDALVPQTRHNEEAIAVDEHGGNEAATG